MVIHPIMGILEMDPQTFCTSPDILTKITLPNGRLEVYN
jgi:hypothetical protein